MQKRLSAVLATVALSCLLFAADATAGSHLVRVSVKNAAQLAELTERGIDVVAVTKDGVDVAADDRQLAFIQSRPYPSSVLMSDTMSRATADLSGNLGGYHTYAECDSAMIALRDAYPSLCDTMTLGLSLEGRVIRAIKVSDNVATDESEPEVLYLGNHHARELMSVEIPLRFAIYLLENYGTDPDVTYYVDNREIWFVPIMNPDGHVYVENNNEGIAWWNWWRKNRRDNGDGSYGVDLNRNWGFEWGYDNLGSSPTPSSEVYRGAGPFSEPETQVLRDFVNGRQFSIWLSYHSYGDLLLYPWGYIAQDTPDHAVFKALGDRLTEFNGYLPGNFNSGAIYQVNGDSDDWGYGEQVSKPKIYAFTPELNSYADGGFGPPDTEIQPTFDENLEMNMLVLQYAEDPNTVLAPGEPTLFAITEPFGNPVHRLTWSEAASNGPNPAVEYEIQTCYEPSIVTDAGDPSLWTLDGWSVAGGYSGSGYYSGSGNNLANTMTQLLPFTVDATTDTITFWVNYNIETNWDYAYVEVSTDGGGSWATIPGNITTNFNPNGTNRGNGITGSSPGWVPAVFPLTAYTGMNVLVRASYITDGAVVNPGIYLDDFAPVATCTSIDVAATANPDTTSDQLQTELGLYRYRVRAVDADGDRSGWSNARDYEVESITGAGAPVPYRTRLGGNYPNPFNPSTTIPFVVGGGASADAARAVRLRVYSVSGALVATLVDGERSPGAYSIVWNGVSHAGEPAASGIYFARLEVEGEVSHTRKLVLLK